MEFTNILNNYIELLNCSSRDLSNSSGISPAAISRYRSGERIPSFNSKQFNNLISGIVKIAEEKNMKDITVQKVTNDFSKSFGKNSVNFDIIRINLKELITSLDINLSPMAKSLNFDASYISRIISGQRKPANVEDFVSSICKYIVKYYSKKDKKNITAQIINCSIEEIENNDNYFNKLQNWIFTEKNNIDYKNTSVNSFLYKLNDFNLDEYIKTIHFDTLKVPTIPFMFSTSKNYYGLDEMKNGELDFFKSTVLSKTKEPIFMYNDMPMEDMAKDIEFGKKWMFAIAC